MTSEASRLDLLADVSDEVISCEVGTDSLAEFSACDVFAERDDLSGHVRAWDGGFLL